MAVALAAAAWSTGCGGVSHNDGEDSDAGDSIEDQDAIDGTDHVDAADTDVSTGEGYAFSRTYGGTDDDSVHAIVTASANGFAVAGDTASFDTGGGDVWVIRLDAGGGVIWQRVYGGSGLDEARGIAPAPDGGFYVAGTTESFGVGAGGAIWVIRLDADGAVVWEKAFGGGSGVAVASTADGVAVAGGTTTHGAGEGDAWILRLDADGEILWENAYGASGTEWPYALTGTGDGGLALAGWTDSSGAGWADAWVAKLDGDGGVTWSRTYGGADGDDARAIYEAAGGDLVVAAWTASAGAGDADAWVLRLDPAGDASWQVALGGSAADRGYGVTEASDGSILVACRTESFGSGAADMWLVKLDASGALGWQRTFGSSYDEVARAVVETGDGFYAVAGKDAYFGASMEDAWLVKIDASGDVSTICPTGMIQSPDASPVTTSVVPADAAVTVTPTSATVADTTATSSDSTAEINEQCRGT